MSRKRKTTKKKRASVRVTHTHEVTRAVQQQPKETNQMAGSTHTENDKPKARDKDAPVVVKSPAGETHPTIELGGDGVTPKAEWDEKYAEIKAKQDEFDEKRRQRAVEDSGIVQTTEKHGVK